MMIASICLSPAPSVMLSEFHSCPETARCADTRLQSAGHRLKNVAENSPQRSACIKSYMNCPIGGFFVRTSRRGLNVLSSGLFAAWSHPNSQEFVSTAFSVELPLKEYSMTLTLKLFKTSIFCAVLAWISIGLVVSKHMDGDFCPCQALYPFCSGPALAGAIGKQVPN